MNSEDWNFSERLLLLLIPFITLTLKLHKMRLNYSEITRKLQRDLRE